MVAIAAAAVVAFISALYFITHRKAEEPETTISHKVAGNGLPPKPEERWRYIKELENRQPGVRTPTQPTAGGEVSNSSQLTDEQRQLLEQMQADMRQQPTQLSEVPWNEQSTAQRQSQASRQQQLQLSQAQSRMSGTSAAQQRQAEQPRVSSQTQSAKASSQPYQDLVQTPPHTQPAKPAQRDAAPVSRSQDAAKRQAETQEKKDERRWMVQCGSFKGSEQAETVRAQLAFEGFDSRITTNNGWNRVVIGPLKGKEAVDNTLSRLKLAGHGNCIRLAFGG